MDLYIRMYNELKRSEVDNSTIGIVFCADIDENIAKYFVLHINQHLFASKYNRYLLTEEELGTEIETQKTMFSCGKMREKYKRRVLFVEKQGNLLGIVYPLKTGYNCTNIAEVVGGFIG